MFAIGGIAIALIAAGIVLGNAIVVTSGVALLGCELVASLYVRQATDGFSAAAYGSALLLVSELAHLSLELGMRRRGGASALRSRVLAVVTLVAASLAVGLSAAAVSGAPLPGSIALTVVGIGGVLAGIAIVAVVLWQGSADSS